MQNHFRRPFVAHYRLLLISPSKMVCSVASCNRLSTIFAAPPGSDLTHHLVVGHKRVDPSYRCYLKFNGEEKWEVIAKVLKSVML